jgi:hypothetical protein
LTVFEVALPSDFQYTYLSIALPLPKMAPALGSDDDLKLFYAMTQLNSGKADVKSVAALMNLKESAT